MEKILTGEARGKGLPGGGKTDQRPGALHVQGTIKEEEKVYVITELGK